MPMVSVAESSNKARAQLQALPLCIHSIIATVDSPS